MMTRINFVAAILFVAIFTASFMLAENAGLFLNAIGLIIVLSGTLGAMFLSYPTEDILASMRVAHNAYRRNVPGTDEIVNTLMDLSVRSRRKGVLALEDAENETTVSFLKRALGMLIDGYSADEIRDILYTEMHYFRERRLQHERLFRHAARLAPAFGVAGSVIGLIAMLSGIGDPQVIMRSIPIALTSTLYGIVLGNFVLTPIAENIYAKTQRELVSYKLITDGVMAIQQEQNTYRLAKKLESFLTPAARQENEHTFEEIRERVRKLQTEG
jgi:chemotaxis protein MotA